MPESLNGRYCSVNIGADVIRGIGSWEIDTSFKELDDSEFGSFWAKSMPSMPSWKGSFSGQMKLTDIQQQALWSAYKGATKITTLRFYLNETNYFAPNLVEDSEAGCYIGSLKIGSKFDGYVSILFNVMGYGPIEQY